LSLNQGSAVAIRGTVSQNVLQRRWIEQSLLDVNQAPNGY